MGNESESRFRVTADDLRRYDWQARLVGHPRRECSSYYEVFVACAKECETVSDELGGRVYALLHVIASFHPNYDEKGNSYGPMWSNFDGKRSLMAEDLTDDDLEALREILKEIADPEYRARVGMCCGRARGTTKRRRSPFVRFSNQQNCTRQTTFGPPIPIVWSVQRSYLPSSGLASHCTKKSSLSLRRRSKSSRAI